MEPIPGTVYIHVPDVDTSFKKTLAAGATSIHEPLDQFYGDRSAGLKVSQGDFWRLAPTSKTSPKKK